MSVLNKMLRDLEQRQHSPNATTVAAPERTISRDDSRPLWLNLLLLLSACLLLFAVYAILNRPDVTAVQTDTVAVVGSPAAEPPETEQSPSDIPAVIAAVVQTRAQPAVLAATTEQPVTRTDSKPASEPEVIAETTANAVATAASQTQVAAAASPAAAVVKVEIQRPQQTAAQKAEALQQQAILAAQSGQLMSSIKLWQQVQALEPVQTTAYIAQARLWLQMGQAERAQQTLQQGLSNGADTAELRLLLAQYFAQQQQWAAADAILLPQVDLQLHPEYYGLKATAAQQLGDSIAAQQWFTQLIVLQPQQARWWLGAAIAFDQHGQRQQAQLHYRQALQWGDSLSAESRNYIQQRLAATE